ncbi:hypothetical protein E3A20_23240, partial [Planctomyces bekefii]
MHQDSPSKAQENLPKDSFTGDLLAISEIATGESITVGEIESILHRRGFATLSLILCIPFIQPVPLPGLSIAFGLAIMALGLRLAFGSAGGLPEFIQRRAIYPKTLKKLVQSTAP